MLFVQFWINSTHDVWRSCQIGLAPAARPILAKFPNITRTINSKLYSPSHDYLYYFKQEAEINKNIILFKTRANFLIQEISFSNDIFQSYIIFS